MVILLLILTNIYRACYCVLGTMLSSERGLANLILSIVL